MGALDTFSAKFGGAPKTPAGGGGGSGSASLKDFESRFTVAHLKTPTTPVGGLDRLDAPQLATLGLKSGVTSGKTPGQLKSEAYLKSQAATAPIKVATSGNHFVDALQAINHPVANYLADTLAKMGGGAIPNKGVTADTEQQLQKKYPGQTASKLPQQKMGNVLTASLPSAKDEVITGLQDKLFMDTPFSKGIEANLGEGVYGSAVKQGVNQGLSGSVGAQNGDYKSTGDRIAGTAKAGASGFGAGLFFGGLTGLASKVPGAARFLAQPVSDATKSHIVNTLTQAGATQTAKDVAQAKTIGLVHNILEASKDEPVLSLPHPTNVTAGPDSGVIERGGPEKVTQIPQRTASSLRSILDSQMGLGASKVEQVKTLGDLITHPDVTPDEKAAYIAQRDKLVQSAPTKSEATATSYDNSGSRIAAVAHDYNPNEAEAPVDKRPLPAAISSVAPVIEAGARTGKDQALAASQFVAGKTRELSGTLSDAIHTPDVNGKPLTAVTAKDQKLFEQIERPQEGVPGGDTARIESLARQADNPAQFRALVEANKAIQDRILAGDRVIPGRENTAQIANHLPRNGHTFVDKNGVPIEKGNPELIPTGDGTPGYVKGRVFPTIAAKEAYVGPNGEHFTRTSSGIVEDIQNQIKAAAVNHGSAQLAKGLNEVYPGQIAVGRDTIAAPVQLKLDRNIYASEKVAAELNSRGNAAAAGKVGRVYDATNQGAKTIGFLGGLFHGATTATSVAGEQLLRSIEHPSQLPHILGDNLKLIGSTFSPKLHESMVESLSNNHAANPDGLSTVDRAKLFNVTDRNAETDLTGRTVDKLSAGKYNPFGAAHEAVFGRQIPDAKLMIFDQATKGLDSSVPADAAKMLRAAHAVNKLGGLDKLSQGMTPTLSKWFGRVWISPDYTQGRALQWKSAVSDFKSPEGAIARNTIIGKTVVSSLAVLTAAVAAGQLNLSDPKAVRTAVINSITDPSVRLPWNGAPTKTNPSGTPQSVHLPTTFISEFTKVLMPALQLNSPDRTQGVKDYLSARLAKLPALAEEAKTNSDYFGNPIYGKDKDGNPISAKQTALNVANQVAPIPVVQASKSAFSGQNVASAFLNTAGLRVGNDKSSAQAGHSLAETDWFNTRDAVRNQRKAVVTKLNALSDAGNYNQYNRVANDWNNSIAGRFSAYNQKHPGNDVTASPDYKALRISPKESAAKTRARNGASSTKFLQGLK